MIIQNDVYTLINVLKRQAVDSFYLLQCSFKQKLYDTMQTLLTLIFEIFISCTYFCERKFGVLKLIRYYKKYWKVFVFRPCWKRIVSNIRNRALLQKVLLLGYHVFYRIKK